MGYYDLLQDTREKHCITIENIVLHRNCEGEEVVGRYEAGLTAKLVHLVEVAPVGIERVVALRTLDNKGRSQSKAGRVFESRRRRITPYSFERDWRIFRQCASVEGCVFCFLASRLNFRRRILASNKSSVSEPSVN
jgi:hypothetical protein